MMNQDILSFVATSVNILVYAELSLQQKINLESKMNKLFMVCVDCNKKYAHLGEVSNA